MSESALIENAFSVDFPYAYGIPPFSARLKSQPDDFIVRELLSFDSSEGGEHLYLQLRKTGENTEYIVQMLAKYFAIKKMDVGVAGMKDRHAVTTQWFSCYLPEQSLELNLEEFRQLNNLNVELLQTRRYSRKLRRGAHRGNEFEILLRDLTSCETLEEKLQRIAVQGVPNYFGIQRFGRNANNLVEFEKRCGQKRDTRKSNKRRVNKGHNISISAARSYLFNRVLAERVQDGTWRECLSGEAELEGLPSGPLWGRGKSPASEQAQKIENECLAPFSHWCELLEHCGLNQERRRLILIPQDFEWQWKEEGLTLRFFLAPGEYATSVIKEISLTQE